MEREKEIQEELEGMSPREELDLWFIYMDRLDSLGNGCLTMSKPTPEAPVPADSDCISDRESQTDSMDDMPARALALQIILYQRDQGESSESKVEVLVEVDDDSGEGDSHSTLHFDLATMQYVKAWKPRPTMSPTVAAMQCKQTKSKQSKSKSMQFKQSKAKKQSKQSKSMPPKRRFKRFK